MKESCKEKFKNGAKNEIFFLLKTKFITMVPRLDKTAHMETCHLQVQRQWCTYFGWQLSNLSRFWFSLVLVKQLYQGRNYS